MGRIEEQVAEDEARDLTGEQSAGVPGIFATLLTLRFMPPRYLLTPPCSLVANKWPKKLGQLFAHFMTELLTEAGQLLGWTSPRQAVI